MHVDLSLEGLTSLSELPCVVPHVEYLKANDNSLTSLHGLEHLPNLRYVHVGFNCI